MKTTILRLDSHDDIVSTRDKLHWAKSGRILLVWPEHGRILSRRVDLTLLQRQASSLGAQLALVTRDEEVRYYAHELAIPVFQDLRKAQKSLWRVTRRRRRRPPVPGRPRQSLETLSGRHPAASPLELHPAVRWFFFALSVLAALALAAAVFPSAVIEVTPRRQVQEIVLPIRHDPQLNAANLSGVVPSLPVQVQVFGEASAPAQGMISVPDQYASGEALFTNLTETPLTIPAGLATLGGDPPGRYLTTQGGELPAGAGQTLSLPVRAALPGASGNLAAEKLYAIEGGLGASVTVANPASIRNGSDLRASTPSAEDRQRLYDELAARLRQDALEQMQGQTPPGSLLYTHTLTLTRVLEQTFLPAGDLPAETLHLRLRLEFQALHTPKMFFDEIGLRLLDASLPPGFTPLSGDLEVAIQPLSSTKAVSGEQRVAFRRTLAARLSSEEIIARLLGRSPVQAQAALAALPLENPPVIRLNPAWWPRLPLLPSRFAIHSP